MITLIKSVHSGTLRGAEAAMAIKIGQGNFINGSFINQGSITLTSRNPSCEYEPVFSVTTDVSHAGAAIDAAKNAYKSWTYKSIDERIRALLSLKSAFIKNEHLMADAIATEMGKIHCEALTEAKSLSARIDLMIEHGLKRVLSESFYDLRAITRYHNQGVLVVLGPYNFPAHLVNAHVIPSILLGNTVVIKPSEVCPMVAEIYAQCVNESAIPAGVINIVHGDHQVGQALVESQKVDGVLFTGSYQTGRMLQEKLLDQPHKILALEMGGKNFAVVCEDADVKQAVLEIITGAYLTTGQRCTATSRLLVHNKIFDRVRDALIKVVKDLRPTKSSESGMFGPMATKNALDRFMAGLLKAKKSGAEVLVESNMLPGGAFVTPSLYQVSNNHPLADYLGDELFGPNLALESFSDLGEAIARINQSPYGLSNAIFSLDPSNAERMYKETKSGVLNINRSTNNAYGQMPFGGVNKSGNQRAAGIDAVRYASFPTAVASQPYGESQAPKHLADAVTPDLVPLSTIVLRHELEAVFETYGIYSDYAASDIVGFSCSSLSGLQEKTLEFLAELGGIFGQGIVIDHEWLKFDLSKIAENKAAMHKLEDLLLRFSPSLWFSAKKQPTMNVPDKAATPRSRAMLDRLYRGHFVPKDKKSLVADLQNSKGAFLASIDQDPLVIFDAASQIATLGAGFQADTFQNSYDRHDFDLAIMRNEDLSLTNNDENSPWFKDAAAAKQSLERFLHTQSDNVFESIAYSSSGAEANEIAFDMCRQHGPGGTRIIAFEGAFHGRTIMSLQATYNKEKRGPFAFAGFEATFIPFPEQKDPSKQPPIPEEFLQTLSRGEIPTSKNPDSLIQAEIDSLRILKEEISKGNICAVIIEPMQCEGGDRYASNRFFSGLRALTRALNVPLIFDEVQTGFHLGRDFFWYQQVNLVDHQGKKEVPDCVTMAKKAQLGICMSVWPSSRTYAPHVIQLKRALLHAHALDKSIILELEKKALAQLRWLQNSFPKMVSHPRACGLAFAFDMPTNNLAMELIEQRFVRGFMAYIAGEKTLRFRLNMVTTDEILQQLFEKLFLALVDIRDRRCIEKVTLLPKNDTVSDTGNQVKILPLTVDNFADFQPLMEPIETAAYEEGRRDSMASLLDWLKVKDSVGLIMKYRLGNEDIIAGYAIGGPLEHSKTDGPKQDHHRSSHNTFYSANITLHERVRGLGLGRLLKNEQLAQALRLKNPDGSPRYLFMSGRNRIGSTSAMSQIVDALGAYAVSIHDNQYGEMGAKASYYRLPIIRSNHEIKAPSHGMLLDCQNSVQTPFFSAPPTFVKAVADNQLRSVVGSKLTLSNWATPAMVRYAELLRQLMPKGLNHTYFTSGRDEMVDKGLRSLRYHRLDADVVIGFSHQWLGHTTAAARSLSHDQGQQQPFAFFSWPKIAHPGVVGHESSLRELNNVLSKLDAKKVLGIVVELVGEKSGLIFDNAYLAELEIIRKKTGIPLVYVDNASSLARSGRTVFLSESLSVKPNMVLWYTGGQLGQVLVDDQYFVEKPLTLISTWDGDEISMARAYHNLLRATDSGLSKTIIAFEQRMKLFKDKAEISGLGCWHAIRFKDDKKLMQAKALAHKEGVLFGKGFDNALMVCPKPDFSQEQFEQVVKVVEKII
jgi:acyl-CoA reductase-like NAD-dependent aldehyde dehydrogenase/4-aminobutyrate aminotransferase-like enzyme